MSRRRYDAQDPKIVRMRLVGTPEMVDDLLQDMSTTRWAIGRIDTYTQRDGSRAIYVQMKRVQS